VQFDRLGHGAQRSESPAAPPSKGRRRGFEIAKIGRLDVSDKIEHPFTFIGRRQWINRRSGLPKAIKNSRLHSILPVFLIRPRLSLGTFVGNVRLDSVPECAFCRKKAMIRHWARNPMKTGVSAKLLPEKGYAADASVKPCRETAYGVPGFPLVFSPMADR
jgi:hypothetical protein